MGIGVSLTLVAILIVLTAFFVATEFAMVRLRGSRISQLVLEGRKNALAVQQVSANLDGYLSACQLGITITALGIGALAEPAFEELLYPFFHWAGIGSEASHVISFIMAFFIATFLHVVIGELAPKTAAINKAEEISLLTAKPIIWFYRILYPLIWLLNGSANILVRLFGMKPASEHEEAHSEEEIRLILSESYESGKINKAEYGYVNRIFAFDEMLARDIMVPRTDMICLYTNLSLRENLDIIRREQYTRFPVAQENKDNIIGMVNTKQLYLEYDSNTDFDFAKLIHPVLTVSEVTPVKTLLTRMQRERVHIALLLDEYGGTSGLITIEDILEEIVGEIRDEFDEDERRNIEKLGETRYLLDGTVSLPDVRELIGLDLEDEEVTTIGGWVYSHLEEPAVGKQITYGDSLLTVREMNRHRVRRVEVELNIAKEPEGSEVPQH
ncbi:HlyC/CorC family transporter [Paenibacillus sp. HN-1]|uniref:hemolysin family protein n=1 Tax=Paenibacillus TaxID=44249 RepID=UPI001CA94777|nr:MULTISPECIES: hemolysin family protein [Paenibacillus]MBY9079289.1 HlyC/CorC family transporter [Paenibacillus sp. CGMCC 1.18879]MBY9087012.1 HlyC/CorC family transporter [Paenibacillus sinensis]